MGTMTFEEFLEHLRKMKLELLSTVTSEKIQELEQSLSYYKNEAKQLEIDNIRLKTRLSEIRNLLNGSKD